LGGITKKFSSTFKEVPNVLCQHIPYISTLVDNISKGKLKESEYKYLPGDKVNNFKTNEVVIFIVGGATYEEAKCVAELNKRPGFNVVLGGTNIVNSKLFLGEITEYEKNKY